MMQRCESKKALERERRTHKKPLIRIRKKFKTFAVFVKPFRAGAHGELINLHCQSNSTLFKRAKQKHKQKLLFFAVHT